MTETADIVIIGAGIIGMCAAHQLSRRTTAKIIVLDKGAGPGEGSTGASSAVCRYKYTHSQMVRLAKDGINAYRNWPEFLGLEEPLAKFHADGVLWLADGRREWPERESKRLGDFGIRTAVLDDRAVKERFPALNPCATSPDYAAAEPHQCGAGGQHLLELDGGYFDPVDALQDLNSAVRRSGAKLRFRSEVSGINMNAGAVTGVALKSGDQISCGAVINAAGPWCNAILEFAGLKTDFPLAPTRIQIVHRDRPTEVSGNIPVCVDVVSGIYFRTQNRGQQIIVGSVLEKDEREEVTDPDDFARYAEEEFINAALHALHHRIPSLPYRGRIQSYSGLYTVNRADAHPVVGRTPVDGFYVANGFSGHGFKLAPAIGSLLAKEIIGGRHDFETDIGPDFLSFDRAPIQLETKSVLA